MEELLSIFGTKGGLLFLFAIILAVICCYGFYLSLPYLAKFGFGYILGIIFLAVGGLGQLAYIRNKKKVNLAK